PQPAPKSEPVRLFIDRLRVSAGEVRFEDHTRPSPFRAQLQPISFELRDFSTTPQTGNAYTLRGASAAGGRLAGEGAPAGGPFSSHGRFEITDLQGGTVGSYLRDAVGFEISSGKVNLTGEYDFATAGLKVTARSVAVSDLGIRPKGQDKDYVHLASLQIDD